MKIEWLLIYCSPLFHTQKIIIWELFWLKNWKKVTKYFLSIYQIQFSTLNFTSNGITKKICFKKYPIKIFYVIVFFNFWAKKENRIYIIAFLTFFFFFWTFIFVFWLLSRKNYFPNCYAVKQSIVFLQKLCLFYLVYLKKILEI